VAFTGVTTVKDHFTSSTKSTQRIETTVAADDSDSSSSSTSASAQDVSSIVSNVMPSVVSITGTFQTSSYFGLGTQESQGAGSGFIIADDDDNLMIATNNHVVEDAKSLTVGFCDDSTAEATIVGTDSDADLAVISVKKTDVSEDTLSQIKVATLGSSDDLKVGEAVIAIGNALGYGQSVTTGVVSAKDREVSFTDGTMVLLQTDAAINPGNSGGVLVNLKGQVIGINNAKLEDTSVEGMGYAIPISTASTLLNDLMNAGSISEKDAAFLGIVGKTIDSTYSEALGMPSGIYVSQVVTDSPAEKAGISAGDVITEFEGNKISTMTGLKEKLALKKADTKVKITLQRANQNGEYEEQTIEVTLGKQSDYADVTTDNTDSSDSSDNNSNSSTQNESDGNNSSNPYEDYYGNGNSNGGSFNPYYYFFNN
jgi:serine protease Do